MDTHADGLGAEHEFAADLNTTLKRKMCLFVVLCTRTYNDALIVTKCEPLTPRHHQPALPAFALPAA